MTRSKTIYAHCNDCSGMRKHLILKKVTKSWNHEDIGVWGKNEYSLLECAGCEDIRLIHQSWFSEETDADGSPVLNEAYYPPSIFRPQPNWFGLRIRPVKSS